MFEKVNRHWFREHTDDKIESLRIKDRYNGWINIKRVQRANFWHSTKL